MSIEEFLKDYSGLKISRWHTPGHKGLLNPFDITELYYGKRFPSGLIGAAERAAAEFYGAKRARFLTGGSSMGIKAAVMAVSADILAPQGCHGSVNEGCALSKKNLYLFGGYAVDGLKEVPTADSVCKAIKKYPGAGAVLIESPDYYGRCVSPAVAEVIKEAGKIFICDAAHGAHFPAHNKLKALSMSGVADICNLSAHKTLDAYTPGAYLCINNESLFDGADCCLKLLGTTSPSYLLFSSLESAVKTSAASQDAYERLYACAENFKKEIPCLINDDFTRIVINAGAFNLSGAELAERLYKQNIAAETDTGGYAVFIATPHEGEDDFKRLRDAVKIAVKG
jgi:arginine/lysine/ornithine decarboxylase